MLSQEYRQDLQYVFICCEMMVLEALLDLKRCQPAVECLLLTCGYYLRLQYFVKT